MFNQRCAALALGFLSVVMFAAPQLAAAQSGRPTETKPVQEIQIPNETLTKPEIPKPKAVYEYLPPQHIVDFLLAARSAGQRGFRLHKVTAVPSGEAETSKEKAGMTVLAGILKYDGENRYDYNFFFAEGEPEPEKKMTALVENGWYFREVITVYGGGADTDPSGLFSNSVYSLPNIGNIYLLERVSQEKSNRKYKLLKAGFGLGKNPTQKMQTLLDEAVKEDYAPVAVYHSFGATSILSVDAFYGVLVEKNTPPEKARNADSEAKFWRAGFRAPETAFYELPEFRFVRANRNEGLRKEVAKLTAEGFRIGLINVNSAILVRENKTSAPVSYQWLPTGEKTHAANFAKVAESNAEFYTIASDMLGTGDFVRNVLIFQDKPAAETVRRFEYKTLRMILPRPKKPKKGEAPPPPPAETPADVFVKMMADGYTPRDLYYSDRDSLNVLFERQK